MQGFVVVCAELLPFFFPSLSCFSAQNCSQHLINKCLVIQMTLLPAGGCF